MTADHRLQHALRSGQPQSLADELTLALLNAVSARLEGAVALIERLDFGSAKELIVEARELLPSENDVHRLPWPAREHFERALGELAAETQLT